MSWKTLKLQVWVKLSQCVRWDMWQWQQLIPVLPWRVSVPVSSHARPLQADWLLPEANGDGVVFLPLQLERACMAGRCLMLCALWVLIRGRRVEDDHRHLTNSAENGDFKWERDVNKTRGQWEEVRVSHNRGESGHYEDGQDWGRAAGDRGEWRVSGPKMWDKPGRPHDVFILSATLILPSVSGSQTPQWNHDEAGNWFPGIKQSTLTKGVLFWFQEPEHLLIRTWI